MRLKALVPLILFVALAIALGVGLTLNPREIPSALIDKPIPEFSLPGLNGPGPGLSAADLRAEEGLVLVNFFASWCAPCRVEHPQLEKLTREYGVRIYGISHKDKPEDSLRFLTALGDPYVKTGADLKGRVSIDWGVYGVPETYFVKEGRIVHKHIGPIHESDLEDRILPKIRELDR